MQKIIRLVFVYILIFAASAYAAEQYLVPIDRNMATISRLSGNEVFCVVDDCYVVTAAPQADWYASTMMASGKAEPVLYYEPFEDEDIDMNLGPEAEGWDSSADLYMTNVSTSNMPIVAIIDTGMEVRHPEFTAGVRYDKVAGHGYVQPDFTGTVPMYDNDGHGTHVAGIIGGTYPIGRIKGTGFSKVKVLPFNVANAEGKLPSNYILKAIDKIIQLKNSGEPIVVVNMSYGQPTFSQAEYTAMSKLKNAGIIAVTAAGNEGDNLSITSVFPANYNLDNIITVGALDESFSKLASFSNYGGTVSIAAPGTNVVSPSYDINDPLSLSAYYYMSGTSMATPFVSGAIGAAFALNSSLTPQQAINLLYKTAKSSYLLSGKVYGNRTINLQDFIAAVDACLDASSCNYSNYPYRPSAAQESLEKPATGGDSRGGGSSSGGGCAMNPAAEFNVTALVLAISLFVIYRRRRQA